MSNTDAFESWWELNHRSLPVHDPFLLAKAVAKRFQQTAPAKQQTTTAQDGELIGAHCPFCNITGQTCVPTTHALLLTKNPRRFVTVCAKHSITREYRNIYTGELSAVVTARPLSARNGGAA